MGNWATPKIKASRTQGHAPSVCWHAFLVALAVALNLGTGAVACQEQPKVRIETPQGTVTVPVEVADTPEKRTRGLMYRKDLPGNAGMLFVFPEPDVLEFWMKNTPLSLDIIFFDRDRRIVGIVERAVPFSTQPLGPGVPSQYVLEVHGGFARTHGIAVGQRAEFIHVPSASR